MNDEQTTPETEEIEDTSTLTALMNAAAAGWGRLGRFGFRGPTPARRHARPHRQSDGVPGGRPGVITMRVLKHRAARAAQFAPKMPCPSCRVDLTPAGTGLSQCPRCHALIGFDKVVFQYQKRARVTRPSLWRDAARA